MTEFAYDLAFDRNIGWLTDWEQLALRQKHVAIAGMGGVGGGHLLTLVRLGIGRFTIADAMWAPVVTRFTTYALPQDAVSGAYCDAVWALPAMQEWRASACA